jgi:N-acetylglucosaminyl-diphospho-decaprenol L-rhamnosyltransferase
LTVLKHARVDPAQDRARAGRYCDVHDLAIITISTNESHWVRALLPTVFDHIGEISTDVVVVDNDSHDGTAELVANQFPEARTVWSANHGFGHANNRALMTCNARYVLFLNPDTEITDGTFAELVALMDARPTVGLVGCRQIVNEDGALCPTAYYFPNALRALGDALSAGRLRRRPRWLGEREVDPRRYDQEFPCDWTTGSFMLVRREALESAGWFDERFFMYAEETDLCRRVKTAGWEIWHLPQMTILHRGVTKDGVKPHVESLYAVTRMMYARKHFSPGHRALYRGTVLLRHLLRVGYAGNGELACQKRVASRAVVATMLGRRPVPFAAITSPVSVNTGDSELREGWPAPGMADVVDGVAR